MLGIDVYERYQGAIDWPTVKADGVSYVYVKATDGGAAASTPGDDYVHGAKSAGLLVGGYHFMQPAPSPETQADVCAAELRRLGALDLAPALDLEASTIPTASRADYARRFLTRLAADLGIAKIAIYSSSSWLASLQPTTWGVPGLLVWVADYGADDGTEHPVTRYGAADDMHQYTSMGALAGITGHVDLDDVRSDITEEDDVSWSDEIPTPDGTKSYPAGVMLSWTDKFTSDLAGKLLASYPAPDPSNQYNGKPPSYDLATYIVWCNYFCNMIPAMSAKIDALTAAVTALAANTSITKDELSTMLDNAVANSLRVSGTISITPATPSAAPAGPAASS